jgi:hypothetical protein
MKHIEEDAPARAMQLQMSSTKEEAVREEWRKTQPTSNGGCSCQSQKQKR